MTVIQSLVQPKQESKSTGKMQQPWADLLISTTPGGRKLVEAAVSLGRSAARRPGTGSLPSQCGKTRCFRAIVQALRNRVGKDSLPAATPALVPPRRSRPTSRLLPHDLFDAPVR